MPLGNLVHGLFGTPDQPVAIRDRIQLDHRGCAVRDVGENGGNPFGVAVVIKVTRLPLDLESHVLGFHDVDGLRPAQIRMLPPPPHDALGEHVLGRFDVLGSCNLENWVIGVDASGWRNPAITQIVCVKQMQKTCINKNCAREAETCPVKPYYQYSY